jgi:hypothetical protein
MNQLCEAGLSCKIIKCNGEAKLSLAKIGQAGIRCVRSKQNNVMPKCVGQVARSHD